MSEGSYKRTEDVDEEPPETLGVPEKQAADLGIHKFVFRGGEPRETASVVGNTDVKPNSVTIVQDKSSSKQENSDEINTVVKNRLIAASVLCLIFILLEFAGGYLSNSLVVAADAAQLFTVFSTIMVALLAIRLAAQGPRSSPISLKRPEVIASLVSILITWVLTSIVLYLAVDRIIMGSFRIDVDMMLATSAFGVVANLVMGMTLHNNCHVNKTCSININVRGAFWHVVGDFLFSVAVFTTALFIDCCPKWHIVDPISTIVFSILVLYITIVIMRDVINVISEGLPKDVYFKELLKTLMAEDGVQQVEDLKLWTIGAEETALSAHLTIRSDVKPNDVLLAVSRSLHEIFNFCEVTLHIEVLLEHVSVNYSGEEKQL